AQAIGSAARSISGSIYRMCAVYPDGRLGCFLPGREEPHVPPTVVPDNSGRRFREVAVQPFTPTFGPWPLDGCAIDEGGKAWCFKLDYPSMETSEWRELDGDYPALQQIRGGATYTPPANITYCALDDDGGLWCWGADGGVIADGSTPYYTSHQRINLPFPVATFAIGTNFAC